MVPAAALAASGGTEEGVAAGAELGTSGAPGTQPSGEALATGRVELRVSPWAEVFYEGQSQGMTPLRALVLPSGRQTLVLKNSRLGIEKRVAVVVPAGGKVVVTTYLGR